MVKNKCVENGHSNLETYCLFLLQVPKWSKFFVPDQKSIYILWQSQTFCARQKDDLHSVKLVFEEALNAIKFFGLAQKIWTRTKHFATCKRTRHYSQVFIKKSSNDNLNWPKSLGSLELIVAINTLTALFEAAEVRGSLVKKWNFEPDFSYFIW